MSSGWQGVHLGAGRNCMISWASRVSRHQGALGAVEGVGVLRVIRGVRDVRGALGTGREFRGSGVSRGIRDKICIGVCRKCRGHQGCVRGVGVSGCIEGWQEMYAFMGQQEYQGIRGTGGW